MIGFVVEGPTDKAFIMGICNKLGLRCKRPRIMRGNKPKKARAMAENLHNAGAEKVIVLKDMRSSPGLLRQMERSIRNTAELVVVKPMIEAWLLADPEAVEKVLGHKPRIRNPEECENPVDELDRTAMRCGRRYLKSTKLVRRIVEEMDLEGARERCSSLDLFLRKLTS